MQFAYRETNGKLERLAPDAPLDQAIWIDLYQPLPGQSSAIEAFGITVPTLEDMEEIEVSSRLYREGGADYMTVVLPGLSQTQTPKSGPVTFILTPKRLVTVRHHVPRPFETFADRADKVGPGCSTPRQVFLGLIEEIIGRLADLLEGMGKSLDEVSRAVLRSDQANMTSETLRTALERVGLEGDLLGRVRLALLTVERAVGFYMQSPVDKPDGLEAAASALSRDIQALEVHADFVGSRVALATDTTLGMINLSQNATVRIVSVVAVLFLPPTLIASVYGMNFTHMPELTQAWGYPVALGLMVGSAAATYLFFKWKNWL